MNNKLFKRIYTSLIFLFMYLPIVVLIMFSFNDSKSRGVWNGFTLKWYFELFKDTEVLMALYYTIVIAVISALIATIIGTITAIGISNLHGFKRKIYLNLNYLPVLNPDIVTAVSLMTLFRIMQIEFGFTTMLLAHIVFSIPYVILSVLPKINQLDKNLIDAALDLGATPFYALRKVIIPEIKPGIISGALIAFTMSVDDFVISFFNKGAEVTNLSITVFSMTKRGINPVINALSTLMFIVLLIIIFLINKNSTKSIGDRGGIM